MARLKLSKSSLQQQREQMRLYERLLPSLDLKRRQLMAQRARAAAELKTASERIAELDTAVGKLVPMLASEGLVVVSGSRSSFCVGRAVGEPVQTTTNAATSDVTS